MAQIGGANSDERGGIGGKLGDQKEGREVAITGWFNGNVNNRYWLDLILVARFWDEQYKLKIVSAMEAACRNNHIGYSQKNRGTLRDALIKLGKISTENINRLHTSVDTDCSALVSICIQCACGLNFGNWYTASMKDALLQHKDLFQIIYPSKRTKETGAGLEPGDILLWRNEQVGQGHTAIVITQDDSYDTSDLYGNYGLVITPTEQEAKKWKDKYERAGAAEFFNNFSDHIVYGEDHNYSVDSRGLLKVAFLREDGQVQYIDKCVYMPEYGRRYLTIFGEDTTNVFPSVFIGDSRTVQLGSDLLDSHNVNYSKQYGLVSDKCLFATWGGTLMQQGDVYARNSAIMSQSNSSCVSNTRQAAELMSGQAYFWLGINDVQIYKDKFLFHDSSTDTDYIDEQFCAYWVDLYKNLISIYKKNFPDFGEAGEKVYIVQIVSTSIYEKDYYQMQGQVIDKLNQLLNEWVASVQATFDNPDDCWLNFLWLDDRHLSRGAQDFVRDRDFVDRIHFTKDWFLTNFFTHVNYNGFTGEKD